MKSRTPKVLHPILGRPMLAYVIDAAREATGDKPLVVYSPQTAEIREVFADDADFALQDEPRGTGDALRAAVDALPADVDEIVVLSGDVPLINPSSVRTLSDALRADGVTMALAAMELYDPFGYGRVVLTRDDGRVQRIVEEKDATDDERSIDLVNAGLYAFDVAWLRSAIGRLTPSPATSELYLTGLVDIANAESRPPLAVRDPGDEWAYELSGVNDREDLNEIKELLAFDRVIRPLMKAGVTFEDPASTYVEPTVQIQPDVTIEANVVLRGSTRIGRDTVIKAGSQVVDSTIGESCVIWASVIEESKVGNDVRVGPFAHLRANCEIGDGAEIGNFAEQKNTRFGARSKQHHFSYLGDAEVGADVNIGAGTITANFDGRQKHKTVIGDRAFIGSDTILRAPLTVGEDAYTGAGSVVTKDVPPGKLAVGVPARIRERRARPDDPDIREH
jgi:bifunctional UDP-N-acetylglucosamine pyrophosphorylase/glucosamine-1-phosphate N-acetyltransferase